MVQYHVLRLSEVQNAGPRVLPELFKQMSAIFELCGGMHQIVQV